MIHQYSQMNFLRTTVKSDVLEQNTCQLPKTNIIILHSFFAVHILILVYGHRCLLEPSLNKGNEDTIIILFFWHKNTRQRYSVHPYENYSQEKCT